MNDLENYIIRTPICIVPDIIVYFGLRKGQALQFNYLYEKGAFVFHEDSTFSVDFAKVSVQVYMKNFLISHISKHLLNLVIPACKDRRCS